MQKGQTVIGGPMIFVWVIEDVWWELWFEAKKGTTQSLFWDY